MLGLRKGIQRYLNRLWQAYPRCAENDAVEGPERAPLRSVPDAMEREMSM